MVCSASSNRLNLSRNKAENKGRSPRMIRAKKSLGRYPLKISLKWHMIAVCVYTTRVTTMRKRNYLN